MAIGVCGLVNLVNGLLISVKLQRHLSVLARYVAFATTGPPRLVVPKSAHVPILESMRPCLQGGKPACGRERFSQDLGDYGER